MGRIRLILPMPDTPIYAHEYLLRSGVALNAVSQRRIFAGALLCVDSGYGCVHPWPEFGDAPVEEQLRLLREGITTPVTAMALRCAQIDGAARRAGVSLFDGLEIPRSHYSWSFATDTETQLQRVMAESWPAIKAKGFANHAETTRFLEDCAQRFETQGVRLRVDFNGVLDRLAFEQFIESMPQPVYRALDFVEDPFPYDAAAWEAVRQRWGVKLALDKGWKNGTQGFDVVVVKPARRDWRTVAQTHPQHPLVLTSAMDHALGQMFAAYEAAVALSEGQALDFCGLCTEHLFEKDAFFERVTSQGGHLTADRSGGGLGFGDVLEGLPWRRL
jgi:O-succinylbenzoate synthase